MKQFEKENKLLKEEINKKNLNEKNNNFNKNELENEIKELNEKLIKANKVINNQIKEIEELKNKINSFKNLDNNNQINNLKNEINMKDNQIIQLRQQLENINLNNNINNNQINRVDFKSVTFISTDNSICYSIPCCGFDTFAEVEEKLYKEYPEYRETNNTFLANGTEILRFKTINDNKIGTGKPIMLVKPN